MAREVTLEAAGSSLANGFFTLLRRGADRSLVWSADKWRAVSVTESGIEFQAEDPEGPPMSVDSSDIHHVTWEQLPRQTVRSQVRFHLLSGDQLIFSGTVDLEPIERLG